MDNVKKLVELLDEVVKKDVSGLKRIGVAFSGGLDSSVIAYLCSKYASVSLYTVGMEGSYDIVAAERISSILGLKLRVIEIDEEDVKKALPLLKDIIATDSPIALGFEMPLFFVCTKMKEDVMLCGQGADELFGGYSKYLKMDGFALEKELGRDIDQLIKFGISKEYGIGKYFGKQVKMPFLDESVVSFSRSVPVSQKILDGERKIILRNAAREMGLGEIADLKKKAAQYGSGVMKVLKKLM